MLNLDKEKEGEGPLLMKDMGKILSSLASEDALKILHEARSGITSSTEAIKKLGLTQKRYYARLKPLIEAELIEKREDGYKLTFLGKIVYEIVYRKLEKTLESKDRIALIDKLNKAKSLSREEKEEIAQAISDKERVIGYSGFLSEIGPVEILPTKEDMFRYAKILLQKAKEKVFLASRYSDFGSIEEGYRCIQRGVKIYFIDGDETNMSKRLQVFRMFFSNPEMVKLFWQMINSPDMQMRQAKIPYSLLVVDDEYAAFEVVNPITREYMFSLVFRDEIICKKTVEIFETFFKESKSDSFIETLKKIKP